MAEIALRTYNQEIKDLIDHGHFDEAIAHCQHILETFPRHIETYRLLGKAFLEQGRHGDAADVFQRVLSAIPEDWLSHVAMAIVREDESNLDMAIWHMERAYEVNPSNTTVQQEVRRLRGRRDGVEPPKLRLTRSALARMYIKGGLFGQAIAEIRSALAEDPDRPDLQTLLASALFDSGAVQEATEICSTILQKLPYCMEANRVLGLALWASDKKEDAEKLFQRLESLDPYIDIDALKKDKRIQEHPGQSITLTQIEWEQQEKTVRSKQPTWASSLGLKIEETQPGRQAIPDWLATASQSVPPSASAAPAASAAPFGGPTPSWFNDAASAMGTGKPAGLGQVEIQRPSIETPAAPAVKTGTGELPDWIKTQNNVPEPPQAVKPLGPLPDWLAAPSMPSSPSSVAAAPSAESTLPDWIRNTAPASTAPAEPISGIPDWLSAPPPSSVDALPSSSLPEWTKPETKTGPLEVEPGNIPDWLSSSKPASPDIGAEPEWMQPPSGGSISDSIPDWMKGSSSPDASSAVASSAEKVPDWLQENPAPQSKPVEIMPEWMRPENSPAADMGGSKPSALFAPETDIPEWMKPEPQESTAGSQTPGFPPPESKIAAPFAPAQPPKDQTYAPENSLPDWMTPPASPAPNLVAPSPAPVPAQNLGQESASAPEIALPDWMTATAAPAAAMPTPIPPAPTQTPPPVAPIRPVTPAQPVEVVPAGLPEVTLPDWLTGPTSQSPIVPAPISSIPSSPAAPMPSIPNPPEEPAPEVFPEVVLPDWLTAAVPPEPATTASKQQTPPQAPAAPVQQAVAAPEAVPEVVLPDWLTAVNSPTPAVPAPAPSTPAPAVEQSAESPAEAVPEIALPDWLRAAAPSVPTIPTQKPSAPTTPPPVPAPSLAPAVEEIPEALLDATLPEWIKTVIPSAPVASAPAPITPALTPATFSSEAPSPAAPDQPASRIPATPAGEKPREVIPQPEEIPESSPISEGIDLPDWLVAQLKGKPETSPTPPAAVKPAVPLPDWLKPSGQSPAPASVVDWDKAAGQAVPSIPADATRPATGAAPAAEKPGAGAAEIPAWLDKSKPSGNETVARWLDRRLKTSTLSSLEEAVSKAGPKPPAPAAPAKPAQSSTQLPTWLDSQKPGGSDTVVRWMDKRETGSLRRTPQSAFADAGKSAFPVAEGTPPPKAEPARAAAPENPPSAAPGTEETFASRRPATQSVAPVPRPTAEPSRAVPTAAGPIPPMRQSEPVIQPPPPAARPAPSAAPAPEEEEEEGAFVPPPEWLQKALGSAVAEVPPNPKEQAPIPEPAAPPQPAVAAEKPASARSQAPPAEEPPPVPTAKPTAWVPMSASQEAQEIPVKPAKKSVKKKTRKLTDIESEALIREARVYLETDLQKASEVYQQIIENPASAEVVANDLTSYLEQDPASPQLWNLLGDACSRAGRFQDAYRAYAEALRRM